MEGYDWAKQILTDNSEALERIAAALLERESLDATEIQMLMDGERLKDKPAPAATPKKEEGEPAPTTTADEAAQPTPPIPPHEDPAPA